MMDSFARTPSMIEIYLKCRPNYPRKLIDFLYDECGFSWDSIIADIGSGTGTFTRLLLERGSRVVGIEPNREMRQTAERLLADDFPRFVSLDATAENTTLSDASINQIVCAQSFHLFDAEKCRREFARIIKPGGMIALICIRPVHGGDEFSREYEALVSKYELSRNGGRGSEADIYSEFLDKSSMSVFSVPGQIVLDAEGLKARTFTLFHLPSPGEDGYDEIMEDLEILFELYNTSGKIVLRYKTEAYAGRPFIDA